MEGTEGGDWKVKENLERGKLAQPQLRRNAIREGKNQNRRLMKKGKKLKERKAMELDWAGHYRTFSIN